MCPLSFEWLSFISSLLSQNASGNNLGHFVSVRRSGDCEPGEGFVKICRVEEKNVWEQEGSMCARKMTRIVPGKWYDYVAKSNMPRWVYQYSNMALRFSGQTSISGAVFFVSNSLSGIERRNKP